MALQPDASFVSVGAFELPVFAAIKAVSYMKSVPSASAKNVGNACAVMPVDPTSATDLTGRNLLHCCSSAEAVSQVDSRIVFSALSSNSCPLCHQVLSRCKNRTSAINAPDAFGCPPLLSMSNSAVVRAFVSRAGTAGMNTSDRSAMTALHHAALTKPRACNHTIAPACRALTTAQLLLLQRRRLHRCQRPRHHHRLRPG